MRKLTLTIALLMLLLLGAYFATRTTINEIAAGDTTISRTLTSSDLVVLAQPAETASTTGQNSDETDPADATIDLTDIAATITFTGDSIVAEGSGVAVNGQTVTVEAAGVYRLNGTLNNGQVIVDTDEEGDVVLLLSGVDITYANGAPIYVRNADNTVLMLAEGTNNYVTDGAHYLFPDAATDEPNAAIFSHDDLLINGSGSLTVNANYNHGIFGKDDVEIASGTITVNAVNDGIKGRDSLVVQNGVITIVANGDGMQSNNDEDAEKGVVTIANGTLNITAAEDAIQAETTLSVSGGDLTLTAGGGSSFTAVDSAKGLKAGMNLSITGGNILIDAADDAIHSNDSLSIANATIQLASGDDGVHADAKIQIDSGALTISKSYEGIESAVIVINGGTIHLVASDDGINVAGGADDSAMGGRPGQNRFADLSGYYLQINGGYIYVDASGDGLDANGSIEMNGGVVLVNGPTANNNGALDYDGGFNITDGYLVAIGSAGMAQAPGTASIQNSLIYNFETMHPAGTLVHIEDANGNNVLTFAPAREYQSVVLSSPQLQSGVTYHIYVGGSANGTVSDGLYTDGNYSAGSAVDSFTLSGVVTSAGVEGRGFRGGPGGERPSRP